MTRVLPAHDQILKAEKIRTYMYTARYYCYHVHPGAFQLQSPISRWRYNYFHCHRSGYRAILARTPHERISHQTRESFTVYPRRNTSISKQCEQAPYTNPWLDPLNLNLVGDIQKMASHIIHPLSSTYNPPHLTISDTSFSR